MKIEDLNKLTSENKIMYEVYKLYIADGKSNIHEMMLAVMKELSGNTTNNGHEIKQMNDAHHSINMVVIRKPLTKADKKMDHDDIINYLEGPLKGADWLFHDDSKVVIETLNKEDVSLNFLFSGVPITATDEKIAKKYFPIVYPMLKNDHEMLALKNQAKELEKQAVDYLAERIMNNVYNKNVRSYGAMESAHPGQRPSMVKKVYQHVLPSFDEKQNKIDYGIFVFDNNIISIDAKKLIEANYDGACPNEILMAEPIELFHLNEIDSIEKLKQLDSIFAVDLTKEDDFSRDGFHYGNNQELSKLLKSIYDHLLSTISSAYKDYYKMVVYLVDRGGCILSGADNWNPESGKLITGHPNGKLTQMIYRMAKDMVELGK